MKDPVHNEKKMSYSFKISTNGKTCEFHAELIDATEDVCQTEEYWPSEMVENHTYTALGREMNIDEFLECFRGMFNK